MFTGLGDKYLRNDGTYASSLYIPPLFNINCKILLVGNDTYRVALLNNINSVITSLGGIIGTYAGTTGIYVNYFGLDGAIDINTISYGANSSGGYDATYDVILYWDNLEPGVNNATVLNTWYSSNKGVIIATFANTTSKPVVVSK